MFPIAVKDIYIFGFNTKINMSYQYCDGISQMEPSIEQFKMFEVHKIQMGSELATNRISWKFHSNDILEVSIQRRELIKKFHSVEMRNHH